MHLCVFGQEKYRILRKRARCGESFCEVVGLVKEVACLYSFLDRNSFMIRRIFLLKNARHTARRDLALPSMSLYVFAISIDRTAGVSLATATGRLIINSLGYVRLVRFRHTFY